MKIRHLIKNILKEESYNKETKRGIDIAIKILKQDFPYIIGWDFDDEYPTSIDLFIVCDIEEAQKFYNSELKPYYLKNKDMLKSDEYAYVVSVLEIGHEMTSDEKFEDYKKLELFKHKFADMYLSRYLSISQKNKNYINMQCAKNTRLYIYDYDNINSITNTIEYNILTRYYDNIILKIICYTSSINNYNDILEKNNNQDIDLYRLLDNNPNVLYRFLDNNKDVYMLSYSLLS